MTYNQEDYIAQAIESALMQQTLFDYEIVIGDDFSTDSTIEIAREYQAKHPEKIKVLYRNKHLGRLYNFSDTLRNCRGKYVALLDGDDYWTDPYKLQKQVDFLEAHPDYVVCHHDAIIVDEHGNIIQDSKLPDHAKCDYLADELTKGTWLLTLTVCFRNLLHEYPPEFIKVVNGDSFLFSLLGQFGKVKYLGDIITPDVYRVHAGGVWSSQTSVARRLFNLLTTSYWLRKYYERINEQKYAQHFPKRLWHLPFLFDLSGPQQIESELANLFVLLDNYLATLDPSADHIESVRNCIAANIYMSAALAHLGQQHWEYGCDYIKRASELDSATWSNEITLEHAIAVQGTTIAESQGSDRLHRYVLGAQCCLPQISWLSQKAVKKVQGRLFAEAAYRCYLIEDRKSVRSLTWSALRADPLLLKDIGLLKRALKT